MMQTVGQVLVLVLMLGAVPLLVGGIFVRMDGEGSGLSGAGDKLPGEGPGLPLRWVSGQVVLWAGFQVICVPGILKGLLFIP